MNMTLRTGSIIAALMVGTGLVFAETVPVKDDAAETSLSNIDTTVGDIKQATGSGDDGKDKKTLNGKLQRQIDYSQGKAEGYKDLSLAKDKWDYLSGKDKYQKIVDDGVSGYDTIKSDFQTTAKGETPEDALKRNAKQMAINRAVADLIYQKATERIADLNKLTEKIKETEDPKQREELELRISAERMMLANEQVRVTALDMEQRAMAGIDEHMKKMILLKHMGLPVGDDAGAGGAGAGGAPAGGTVSGL